MPLPIPRQDEKQKEFLARFLGDGTMLGEYPDESRRRGVGRSQWDRSKKRKGGRGADPLGVLLRYVERSAWAMERTVLDQMVGIVERHVTGVRLTPTEIEARIGKTGQTPADWEEATSEYRVEDGTAVVPIFGLIAKYAELVNGTSQPQGTSVEVIGAQLERALEDPLVKKIVLLIESPGGSVAGLLELAAAIREASTIKPVIAYIEDYGTSAAYWLASGAQAIYANREAITASIGVYAVVVDSSRMAEDRGLKFHLLRSGPRKGMSQGVPITNEQLAGIQAEVDQFAVWFREDVLRGRADAKNPPTAEALASLEDGRSVMAAEALELGLIDGIATWKQALAYAVPNPRAIAAATTDGSAELEIESQEMQAGDSEMSEQEKKKADDVTARAEEAARAEGMKAERERISAIRKALPGEMFAEAVDKAIHGSLEVTAAVASAMPAAMLAIESLQADLAEANKRLDAIAKGGGKAIAQEAGDDQAAVEAEAKKKADEGEPAKAFEAKVDELVKGGKSITEAYAIAEKADPEGFDAWRAAQPTSPVKRRR